jgi:hypothetical protein
MHEPDGVNVSQAGGAARSLYQAPSLFGLEHYGTKERVPPLRLHLRPALARRRGPASGRSGPSRKGDGVCTFDRDTYFHWSDDELDGVLLRPADPKPEPARTRAGPPTSTAADLDLTPYCTRDARSIPATSASTGSPPPRRPVTYPIERLYTRLRTHTP